MNELSTGFYTGQIPHPNYPRPQFKRENSVFINLNGPWNYQIINTKDNSVVLNGEILVPFPPESSLSGVKHILKPDEMIIYTKNIFIGPDSPLSDFYDVENESESAIKLKGRLFLNIEACDFYVEVLVNEIQCYQQEIGYIPASIEITNCVKLGDNTLTIRVTDPTDSGLQPVGKQTLKPGGIFYTSCSGIWQTIWLETTPMNYIESIKITPNLSENSCRLEYNFCQEDESEQKRVKITVFDKNDHSKTVLSIDQTCGREYNEIVMNFGDNKLEYWTPETPNLYEFEVEIGDDKISSYFGMREFGLKMMENGKTLLVLNNEVCFMSGLLDQGYWPESNLCPPSEEAIISDLTYVKSCGFNMIRKHIKIEPKIFYYHCDRIGLIVWQDIVNGAAPYNKMTVGVMPFVGIKMKDSTKFNYSILHRSDEKARKDFELFIQKSINCLYNVVSIGLWTLFNEGWGQFDSVRLTNLILEKCDKTRPIDSTSGWYDQGENVGQFQSLHIYFKKISLPKSNTDKRAIILSEFGGYSLKTDNSHLFMPKDSFGYKEFKSVEQLQEGISNLYRKEVIPCIEKGLCATVYTQLTDVETEINGLITYDRKVKKLSPEFLSQINKELYELGNKQ